MKKIISSILMVTGTTIGGGMVVLPAVLGVYSYYSAISILIAVWLVNITIALIFLEANCYFPSQTSLISMSRRLLGRYGAWVAWVVSLIFLYTIMSVYTSGMAEMMGGFLEKNVFFVPSAYLSILSVIIMSVPIYFGMKHINFLNRLIVISMLSALFMSIFFIIRHIEMDNLSTATAYFPTMAIPIVFTSFGFLIIIPRIRSYLDDNIKYLKISIIVGSLIPLLIYIFWVTVVMGIIPALGESSLKSILQHKESVKNMTQILIASTGNLQISFFIQVFIFFAIASSFIGTSVGLYDFLADGLKIAKTQMGKIKLLALTFLPPLLITLTQSNLFIKALGFAGLMSAILFGLYPVMLAWSGRYVYNLHTHYRVAVNRIVLLVVMVFAVAIVGIELFTITERFFP